MVECMRCCGWERKGIEGGHRVEIGFYTDLIAYRMYAVTFRFSSRTEPIIFRAWNTFAIHSEDGENERKAVLLRKPSGGIRLSA